MENTRSHGRPCPLRGHRGRETSIAPSGDDDLGHETRRKSLWHDNRISGRSTRKAVTFAATRPTISPLENAMLGWALTFLIIALIAGVLGFGVVAGTAATIAKLLFIVFLVLFIIGLVMGRRGPAV